MKLLIWGAGAIGGTIGAYLARAGHDVTWVDQVEAHVEAVNAKGMSITGPVADFTVEAPAYLNTELNGTFDTILLCTKALHTRAATEQLEPHLSQNGVVVSVQNGLNERVIADLVGERRTLGCFVNFGADYLEPGVIHYGGRGAVVLGELDGKDTQRLRELHRAFLEFDENAVTTDNIWGYLWSKLAYGAMLFATALTQASIADALAEPKYRDLFIALPKEVLSIAVARDITPESFNGFTPAAFLPGAARELAETSLDEMVAFNRRSTKTHSGVWRDLAVRKRKTEIDEQLGPILELGQEVGMQAPLVTKLIDLVHDVEAGKLRQGWHALDKLKDVLGEN